MENIGTSSENAASKSASRRIWTIAEEKVLIASLKELVAKGWKGDNGFRVGYLVKLEDALKESFPGTDLRSMPHIVSKLGAWKKCHGSLSSMLGRTGVNLNPDRSINCDTDEIWDAVIAKDLHARKMRFKRWPLYEEWCEVFGQDRANGGGTEDVMHAVNMLINEHDDNVTTADQGQDNTFVNTGGMNPGTTEDEVNSVNHSGASASASKKSKGKRKLADSGENLCDLVRELCVEAKGTFNDIAKGICYEHSNGERRQQLSSMLDQVGALSTAQKHMVGVKLARDKDLLEYFIGLRLDERYGFVLSVLQNEYD